VDFDDAVVGEDRSKIAQISMDDKKMSTSPAKED
jgi:hypothetical protein